MTLGRVLVANRGEIALRVIRACHDEAIEAVAVYSDADERAPFVAAADIAVPIGPAAAARSYLDIDALLEAARATGCDAVHPGYGFLSERATFARAVESAGLTWIGPPASAIAAMGDKTAARALMARAGVPVVPGSPAAGNDPAAIAEQARKLGYPVLVKAAAGGGGKGMRLVSESGELAGAIVTARAEAEKAFGDGTVYLEKFIERPRHVEVQILADASRTVSLGERECSIQRRHQKLLEEAPSIAVDADLRRRMGEAAIAAAQAVGYRSAGTCEFLLGADGEFHFLEMNTRIQVEHPVTELTYGVDLVREQLRIGAGKPMRVPAGELQPRGWSIECRITSEDPINDLLPSSGTIEWLRAPAGPGVRWESGVATGSMVSLHYDSMLAKLIVHAEDRGSAIAVMKRALDESVIVGVATNIPVHRNLLDHPDFISGQIDIQFLERHPELLRPVADEDGDVRLAIVAAMLEDQRNRHRELRLPSGASATEDSAWRRAARLESRR